MLHREIVHGDNTGAKNREKVSQIDDCTVLSFELIRLPFARLIQVFEISLKVNI